jgi:hypothetical protein
MQDQHIKFSAYMQKSKLRRFYPKAADDSTEHLIILTTPTGRAGRQLTRSVIPQKLLIGVVKPDRVSLFFCTNPVSGVFINICGIGWIIKNSHFFCWLKPFFALLWFFSHVRNLWFNYQPEIFYTLKSAKQKMC